jgi:alkanesulfonate monooxygenase SsuD/methylene tetrahydromethanopterin reductase-like flavin-dependent oxidoreductase (luciferase family)
MEYGAHLPLIDFDGEGWAPETLTSFARTAARLGFRVLAANDHLVFSRPWLDGIVALASVVEASGDLTLATTAALPVVRGPAALAKAAAALDLLSGGRLVLGVGPGSSRIDYEIADRPFEQRWPRFDEAVPVLLAHLRKGWPAVNGRFYSSTPDLEPRPHRDGPPIWVASWGSEAGLRRVARFGDGWLASAYNTTPERVAAGRRQLREALALGGRPDVELPCALATMWTYVTDDERRAEEQLVRLAAMLNRPREQLTGQLLVGPADQCAQLLQAYASAGVTLVCIWPLAEPEGQLERFMREVVPLVQQ